jgi:hypothetical protein
MFCWSFSLSIMFLQALSLLARSIEADPSTVILWVFYLHIYYQKDEGLGKDDMFSHAVPYLQITLLSCLVHVILQRYISFPFHSLISLHVLIYLLEGYAVKVRWLYCWASWADYIRVHCLRGKKPLVEIRQAGITYLYMILIYHTWRYLNIL